MPQNYCWPAPTYHCLWLTKKNVNSICHSLHFLQTQTDFSQMEKETITMISSGLWIGDWDLRQPYQQRLRPPIKQPAWPQQSRDQTGLVPVPGVWPCSWNILAWRETQACLLWEFSSKAQEKPPSDIPQGRWLMARQPFRNFPFSLKQTNKKEISQFPRIWRTSFIFPHDSFLLCFSVCPHQFGKATSFYNQYLSGIQFPWQQVGLVALTHQAHHHSQINNNSTRYSSYL